MGLKRAVRASSPLTCAWPTREIERAIARSGWQPAAAVVTAVGRVAIQGFMPRIFAQSDARCLSGIVRLLIVYFITVIESGGFFSEVGHEMRCLWDGLRFI